MSTKCPRCKQEKYFKYMLGFSYSVPVEGYKRKKKRVYISDSITCVYCEFSWEVEDKGY